LMTREDRILWNKLLKPGTRSAAYLGQLPNTMRSAARLTRIRG